MPSKILIVEDDQFILRAYLDGLKRAGFEVFSATDGEEGLNVIKSEKPDLVLLDLMMPVKNGFEVLEDMKSDEELKKIPVIVLSNLGHEADIKKGKALGASDYLIKSNFSIKEVTEKINNILEK